LSHAASENDGGIGNTTGYMGLCFTGGVWNDSCALIENKDFCQAIGGGGAVADPSSESIVPSTVQNIPGFVMELGLGSLKMINDYTGLSPVPANATKGFPLAIYDPGNYITWPPQGLIQKHQENIRFGVMTFQENGSGSECNHSGTCSATTDLAQRGNVCTTDANCPNGSCIFDIPCVKTCQLTTSRQCYTYKDCPITGGVQESCVNLLKRDGGKILTNAYLGAGTCSVTTATHCVVNTDCPSGQTCIPSIGDHDAGLLRSIDDIVATSWTPFAEGYYNAMGYLARDNAYGPAIVPLSRTDTNFNSLPSPDTALSYLANKNPSQFRCQSNNLLLITDGMSTADTSSSSEALATLYASQIPYNIGGTTYKPGDTGYDAANNHGYDSANKCPTYSGSRSVNALAWVAKNRNIKTLSTTAASTTPPETASESITTYVVYSGPQTSSHPGLCDPKTLMNSTAENGGTTLLAATNPSELYDRLDAALSSVAAKAASGTAASILSNSEGSGANMLQAVFYPKKIFDSSTAAGWIGEMQNLWYYVDPYVQNSTIREDTDGNLKLNLVSDYVTRFMFDNTQDKTMVQLYSDSNGDGIVTDSDKVNLVLIDPDYVKSIWRAGMKLWARNDDTSLTPNDPRTIYTGYNSTSDSTPNSFSNSNLNPAIPATAAMTALWNDLEIPAGTESQRWDLTTKLISYIRGTDQPDDDFHTLCLTPECEYRKRKVIMGVCSSNNQKRCATATVGTDCPSGNTCTPVNREWKLGDIISSTPRVQSTVALNTFNRPPSGGYSDRTYESFINSNNYKSRGMVYVGANDGMLHAFNLGTLSVEASGFQKASLTPLTGAPIGAENWAFIPKNSLPYLKHTANKNYSHLYFIDGRTVLLDASIGDTGTAPCDRATYWECAKPRNGSIKMVDSSNNLDAKNIWRTVVIGAMGLGGASRNNVSTESCTEGSTGSCVRTPSSGIGYSSYFALDVTNPLTPKFLWEFSNDNLGYSTTAPAIIRVGSKEKNGRWFAVFGNGPFGPIDTGSNQFKGQSNKHLRFFVVDLRTGDLVHTLNDDNALGIDNAFAGAMLGSAIDADRRDTTRAGNYQDDAFYAGYVKKAADNTWTDGGVVRIMTKEDINPANWVVSKVIDGIGPVTTAIARSQDTKNRILWLYFGTGRYFYRDSAEVDDNANARSLFGIQEPCYNTTLVQGNALDGSCTDTVSAGSLVNQSTSISTLTAANKGWRINLDEDTTAEGAERVVTDTVALTNGTVFFTTFKPTMDICGYGGNSFLWGVKYDTGGQAAANALHGKALIQLSTGEFKEVDLSDAFGQNGPDDPLNRLKRRMASPMTGKPPSDAPPIVSNSMNRAVKKILHIQEH
jgi:type IV pilus assembly protein PilY1